MGSNLGLGLGLFGPILELYWVELGKPKFGPIAGPQRPYLGHRLGLSRPRLGLI